MPVYIIRCTKTNSGPIYDERKRWEPGMVIAGHPDDRETDPSKALLYTDRANAETFCNTMWRRGDFEVVAFDLVERK